MFLARQPENGANPVTVTHLLRTPAFPFNPVREILHLDAVLDRGADHRYPNGGQGPSGMPTTQSLKSEYARLAAMAARTCRVTITDLESVSHTVEVTATTLYEAIALRLAALRDIRHQQRATFVGPGGARVTSRTFRRGE
jgi:hypothetical protein